MKRRSSRHSGCDVDADDLIQAISFAHYAERFRDKLFVIGLTRNTSIRDLLLDFKVLAAYGIRVVLLAPDSDLDKPIELSNTHGTRFRLFQADKLEDFEGKARLQVDLLEVQRSSFAGETPVISAPTQVEFSVTERLCVDVSLGLGAHKVLLASQTTNQIEKVFSRNRVTLSELDDFANRMRESEVAHFTPRLDQVRRLLEGGVHDVTFLIGTQGRICEEVFTPDGGGILFSRVDQTRIRRAELRDVTNIGMYIRRESRQGRLLPVDENDIAADIRGFWLCEVDDQLVAVMRLKRYGTWAELGAATSLSRERGRRHSGALVMRLLGEAKKEGLAAVFVLGKDTRMASTFGALGFEEIDRSELPAQWKEHYDMSRPTRAFVKYPG
jgi:N-acetylglutamate synthase-like GNAT family acetyltransferase